MSVSKISFNARSGLGALPMMLLLGAIVIEIAVAGAAAAVLRNNALLSKQAATTAYFTALSGVDDGILRVVRDKNFSSAGYPVVLNSGLAWTVVVRDVPITGETMVTASSSVLGRIKQVQAIINVSSVGEIDIISKGEVTN